MSTVEFKYRVQVWLICWVDILDSLVFICSFTTACTTLGMKLRVKQIKARLKKQLNNTLNGEVK